VTREQVAQSRELGKDALTGKPVTVRMGQYGPFVQIGTKDDIEKPRFAGLRPGQKMDALTLADAMELFKLPRTLGDTAAGEPVMTNVGRFGPYVKYGSKYVSLKEDDPYTVTLERALEVIRLKQEADANRIIADFGVDGIQVLNGRYGPYVTDGKKNAKIPKDREPKSLTIDECRVMIEQAPARGSRFGRGKRGGGMSKQAAFKQGNGQDGAKSGVKKAANGDGAGNGTGTSVPDRVAARTKTTRPRPPAPAAAVAKANPRGTEHVGKKASAVKGTATTRAASAAAKAPTSGTTAVRKSPSPPKISKPGSGRPRGVK
jgi:DNA topoisomerase-1